MFTELFKTWLELKNLKINFLTVIDIFFVFALTFGQLICFKLTLLTTLKKF